MQDRHPDMAQGSAPGSSQDASYAAHHDHAPHAGRIPDTSGRDLFTTLTPGLIIATLPAPRARAVAHAFEDAQHAARLKEALPRESSAASTPCGTTAASRALLRLLTDQELRRIAMKVGLPTDGHYLSLYHRLALLC